MFHGTKVPRERKFSLWTFRSLERKCRGTKRPVKCKILGCSPSGPGDFETLRQFGLVLGLGLGLGLVLGLVMVKTFIM